MATGDRTAVLVAAAGAPWESGALQALTGAGLVVLKRCVDLADLLASAGSGQADVAVVSSELPGLDAAAVTHLLRHDVRTLAVGAEGVRGLARIGVVDVLPVDAVADLADALQRVTTEDLVPDPEPDPDLPVPEPGGRSEAGRVVVVWGPAGAPGRTTVAVSVAAELARRRRRVVLADLDPWGGSVAQHLGVLDEVSGLLAAARLANAGELDRRRFAATRRMVGDRLEVLTGLPRADRWPEVRDGVAAEILERAAEGADVVVDTGFALEDTESDFGRPGAGRNRMTLEALRAADEVLVVGAADPVGLTRLARGLVELGEVRPAGHAAGRRQPDARQPGLGRARHPGHGRGLRPPGGRALPARRPRRLRPRAGRRAGAPRVRRLGAAPRPRRGRRRPGARDGRGDDAWPPPRPFSLVAQAPNSR